MQLPLRQSKRVITEIPWKGLYCLGAGCTFVITLWWLTEQLFSQFLFFIVWDKHFKNHIWEQEWNQRDLFKSSCNGPWRRWWWGGQDGMWWRARSRLIHELFWWESLNDLLMDWMLRRRKNLIVAQAAEQMWNCWPRWGRPEKETAPFTCLHILPHLFPHQHAWVATFIPIFQKRKLGLSEIKLFSRLTWAMWEETK